jgi:hypothetical protein
MKLCIFLLALLLAVAAFAGAASDDPIPHRIWITDITLVSPGNLAHLDKGSVLIEGERIVRTERKAPGKPSAGVNRCLRQPRISHPRPYRLARPSCVDPKTRLPRWSRSVTKSSRSYLYFGPARRSSPSGNRVRAWPTALTHGLVWQSQLCVPLRLRGSCAVTVEADLGQSRAQRTRRVALTHIRSQR